MFTISLDSHVRSLLNPSQKSLDFGWNFKKSRKFLETEFRTMGYANN